MNNFKYKFDLTFQSDVDTWVSGKHSRLNKLNTWLSTNVGAGNYMLTMKCQRDRVTFNLALKNDYDYVAFRLAFE